MRRRVFAGAICLLAAASGIALLPWALSHVGFFTVRQVELIGVRYHSPERLLEALDLEPDRNLFDPLGEVEERALELSGVLFAKAKRRMPGTLTIEVGEAVPVAFVPTSTGLLALDAAANVLAYDPTATGLDLPIVPRRDSALVSVLAAVSMADSTLYERVDGARFGEGDMVVLELGRKSVVLPKEPTIDDIRAVALVRRHLTTIGRSYDQLDARFEGRVLVRGSGV